MAKYSFSFILVQTLISHKGVQHATTLLLVKITIDIKKKTLTEQNLHYSDNCLLCIYVCSFSPGVKRRKKRVSVCDESSVLCSSLAPKRFAGKHVIGTSKALLIGQTLKTDQSFAVRPPAVRIELSDSVGLQSGP